MCADTVARLARLPNIIGIKDASGDLARVSQHAALIGDGEQFVQLCGDDPIALGHLAMGASAAFRYRERHAGGLRLMHKAFNEGDLETARAIERRLIALHKAMFCSPSPGPAKYVLHRLGLCEPDVRLPLTPPDAAAREQIDAAMALAGLHA